MFACERIGFNRNDDNAQLKRRVDRASQELEDVGFLRRQTKQQRFRQVRRGQWEVMFLRSPTSRSTNPGRRTADPLEAALIERGVRHPVAVELVRDHSAATIRKCVHEFDGLRERGGCSKLENPPGLLISWIKNSHDIPSDCTLSKATPAVSKFAGTEAAESHTKLEAIRG
ncbi:MAG: hypothetical protein ACYC6Y_15435, partial [Thermoguttaceae bacterium]